MHNVCMFPSHFLSIKSDYEGKLKKKLMDNWKLLEYVVIESFEYY